MFADQTEQLALSRQQRTLTEEHVSDNSIKASTTNMAVVLCCVVLVVLWAACLLLCCFFACVSGTKLWFRLVSFVLRWYFYLSCWSGRRLQRGTEAGVLQL